jgi:hypothetical protein
MFFYIFYFLPFVSIPHCLHSWTMFFLLYPILLMQFLKLRHINSNLLLHNGRLLKQLHLHVKRNRKFGHNIRKYYNLFNINIVMHIINGLITQMEQIHFLITNIHKLFEQSLFDYLDKLIMTGLFAYCEKLVTASIS